MRNVSFSYKEAYKDSGTFNNRELIRVQSGITYDVM